MPRSGIQASVHHDPSLQDFRSGFVALCGRPNVGKSTLLNALIGEQLAVTSPRPQTTRERHLGIWTTEQFQAVLVDTPGIHRPQSALNQFMVSEAVKVAEDADVVILLAEIPDLLSEEATAQWRPGEVALEAARTLVATGRPIILVLTKLDRLQHRAWLMPVISAWSALYNFSAIVPVSANTGEGLPTLTELLQAHLPVHPPYYDTEQLSDRDLRWHAAELIRKQLFTHLQEELPYSCAVTISSYKEQPDHDVIHAAIHVERDSQKGIVIGSGAKTVRAISQAARQDISAFLHKPCQLFLAVRVTPRWTQDPEQLVRLGYTSAKPR